MNQKIRIRLKKCRKTYKSDLKNTNGKGELYEEGKEYIGVQNIKQKLKKERKEQRKQSTYNTRNLSWVNKKETKFQQESSKYT